MTKSAQTGLGQVGFSSNLTTLHCGVKLASTPTAATSNWRPERPEGNDDDGGYEDILSSEEWQGVREVVKVLKHLV